MSEISTKYWTDGVGAAYYLSQKEDLSTMVAPEEGAFVSEFLKGADAKTLLDVGCGCGRFFKMWKDNGLKATGTDLSPIVVNKMKGNKYGVKVKQLDLTKAKLKEKFDVVFSTQMLLHILPRDIEKAFANYVAMSKEHIVIIVWHDPAKVNKDPKAEYDLKTNLNSFSHPYHEMFSKHGLQIVKESTITFPSGATNKGWILRKPTA